MKKGKKTIALGLLLCMVLSLAACNGGNRDLSLKGARQSGTKQLERNEKVIFSFADSVYSSEGYKKDQVMYALTDFSLNLLARILWEQ